MVLWMFHLIALVSNVVPSDMTVVMFLSINIKPLVMFQKLINDQNPKSNNSEIVELKSLNGHLMTWAKYHRFSGE